LLIDEQDQVIQRFKSTGNQGASLKLCLELSSPLSPLNKLRDA